MDGGVVVVLERGDEEVRVSVGGREAPGVGGEVAKVLNGGVLVEDGEHVGVGIGEVAVAWVRGGSEGDLGGVGRDGDVLQ